jgi:erythromycin esterase-like protein
MYGRDLVIFGFAFERGSFHAVPEAGGKLTTFTTPPARPGSLDALLAATAPPLAVIDLRGARGDARRWLTSVQTSRTIAEHYAVSNDDAYYARLRPLQTFDAIVFVKETTPSTLRAPAPVSPLQGFDALEGRP